MTLLLTPRSPTFQHLTEPLLATPVTTRTTYWYDAIHFIRTREPGSPGGVELWYDQHGVPPATGLALLPVNARHAFYADVCAERPETPPQPFATIPFARDRDFIDRGDILNQLRRQCSETSGRVALVGLGGIGYVCTIL